ncbi:hypothetical protein [Actinoplanes rectilineatus]|uniref:hypothetical protein n=1 Tax=Actinoplanes rectilineatus TaxID=113571 RepID=UPI0005F28C30|nr:hypothetical protein [Actinoplanes rectilineatus]
MTFDPRGGRTTVAVVFGGSGTGYQDSCESAANVLNNLDRQHFACLPVCVTPQGRWNVGREVSDAILLDGTLLSDLTDQWAVEQFHLPDDIARTAAALATVDVALSCVRECDSRAGILRAMLEIAHVAQAGFSATATLVAADRERVREYLTADGISVMPGTVLHDDWTVSPTDRTALGLPVFVKPCRVRRGPGLSLVTDWADLADAIGLARTVDSKVLVEAATTGPRVSVAVLQHADGRLSASPAFEPGTSGGFAVAALPPGTHERLADLACAVFRSLDCAGLLHVEFTLHHTPAGMFPAVLEVDVAPGLHPTAPVPRMWAEAGVPLARILETVLSTALVNHSRQDWVSL